MQLHFHGVGAAFHPAMGNNGAFFAHGDDLYLIDCGDTAFRRVSAAGLFAKYPGAVTVLLTHTHADHCGSLGTLCLYAAEVLRRPVTVVHPDMERARALLTLFGARGDQYRLLADFDARGVRAIPAPVRHVVTMPAYAYWIEANGETIWYSGDSGDVSEEAIAGVRAGRVARAYQDAAVFAGQPPANPAHAPLTLLTEKIEPALRGRFTLMHFNRDFRQEARALGFDCAEIDPVFDVKEIEK